MKLLYDKNLLMNIIHFNSLPPSISSFHKLKLLVKFDRNPLYQKNTLQKGECFDILYKNELTF